MEFLLDFVAQGKQNSICNSQNFAVSYGTQENNRNAAGATASVTEDVTGISASYTVGAASVRFHHAEASNSNFVSQTDDEHTELGVVLAF